MDTIDHCVNQVHNADCCQNDDKWGCEIFNAHILHDDVAVPFLPQRIYDPDSWCRSDGRVDRNVFRLDTPWDYFFVEIS